MTYANGEKEILYYKDFASGALTISPGPKYAIKRMIASKQKGLIAEDLLHAIKDEFKEHEDLPNTTNPMTGRIADRKERKLFMSVRWGEGSNRNIGNLDHVSQ